MSEYKIPTDYYFRIHHVRPRFKNDVQSVLLYLSSAIARLPKQPTQKFKCVLNNAIRCFPGNLYAKEKTINNWRTEISALFGFIQSDTLSSWPGLRAKELAQDNDLPRFFATFLYFFQYPGAHIKPKDTIEQIQKGVRFKPAQKIISILRSGEDISSHPFGISKAEACHCLFNDLRVTAGLEDSTQTAARIIKNRNECVTYDETGDVIRYAGDILDYRSYANILRKHNGLFYLNKHNGLVLNKFEKSSIWFSGYDQMIQNKSATLEDVKSQIDSWFSYVNQSIDFADFDTDIDNFILDNSENYSVSHIKELLQQYGVSNWSTKNIGDIGESIVLEKEKTDLKKLGYDDLVHLVQKIPNTYAVGYDIQSFWPNKTKKYIEVKTTISTDRMTVNTVHLTPNEWNTASTLSDNYLIYRILITNQNIQLFIIQNPIRLYKENKINAFMNDGVDIIFNKNSLKLGEEII